MEVAGEENTLFFPAERDGASGREALRGLPRSSLEAGLGRLALRLRVALLEGRCLGAEAFLVLVGGSFVFGVCFAVSGRFAFFFLDATCLSLAS